eukprot:scaffold249718_cov12-Tisochrysis_lutea.AAC.1
MRRQQRRPTRRTGGRRRRGGNEEKKRGGGREKNENWRGNVISERIEIKRKWSGGERGAAGAAPARHDVGALR